MKSRILRGRLVLLLFFILGPLTFNLLPDLGHAAGVTIGWDPSLDSIAGYEFCYGRSSGNYDYSVDVGNNTSCSVSGLQEGTTYYFAARAYNSTGLKSEYSAELSYTIPASGSPPPPSGDDETKIWIEAEDGVVYPPMGENWDDRASSGGYIWVPKGYGNLYDISGENGLAEYTFEVQKAGTYLLWGRVISNNLAEDSFFIAIDGGEFVDWHTQLGGTETWIWDQFRDGPVSNDNTVYLDLEAGKHTLTIAQREDGTKIDRILLTRDMGYVPEGVGENTEEPGTAPDNPPLSTEPPANTDPADFKLWLEAEDGIINSPFDTRADSKASGGQYVWVPRGLGNSWDPEQESGSVVYHFDVLSTGNYVVWGLVRARTGSDNSFYVAVDDGAYALWDTKRSRSWTWDPVSSRHSDPVVYHLEAGGHSLIIKQREDGTKLDQILITGDLSYNPK